MMDNGLKINITEKVYIILKMGQNMMDNGKIMNLTDLALLNLLMEINMKGIINIM